MSNKSILSVVILSLIIPLLFFIIGVFTINDYGETTDEKFDQHIGEYYYHQWKVKGIEGLKERFIPLQRNYGPFFDVITVASNDILYRKLNLIKNPVASYHLPTLIISSLSLWAVFWLVYFNLGLPPALLSALTFAILPRFIGDSQNNLKDTPLMFFFLISIIFFYTAIKKRKLIFYIPAGIFFGLTYTIKINGLIILPIIGSWFFLTYDFRFKKYPKVILSMFFSLITGLITVLIFWPYYRYDTIRRFIETYSTFKNHEWNEYILYLGNHIRGHEIPWHYPLVMFGVTTPVFYLIFLVLAIIFALGRIRKKTSERDFLLLLLLWLLFPPLTQILSKAPMYDGIRHFLTILPPLCILIAYGIYKTGLQVIRAFYLKRKWIVYIFFSVIALNYLLIIRKNILIHPYEIVYFNEIIGGARGAYGIFDLDYWGQSLQEAAFWINKNLPTGSRIWLTIPMEHHFPVDRSRFYLTRNYPNYKVSLIRGMLKTWDTEEDYLHPKRKPIYIITADGAEILKIYKTRDDSKIKDLAPLYTDLPSNYNLKPGITAAVKFNNNSITETKNTISFNCEDNAYKDLNTEISYTGYLKVDKEGKYCFSLSSDDEVLFSLNDRQVIINPSMGSSYLDITLHKGYYKIALDYFNTTGPACLNFKWSDNNCAGFSDPAENLFTLN